MVSLQSISMLKKKPLFLAATTITLLALVLAGVFVAGQSSSKKEIKLPAIPSATPKLATAILEIFVQPVAVKLPGKKEFSPAKDKMLIPVGTQIKTGKEGRAQIVFPGGTVTRVDTESVIHLKEFDPEKYNIFIEILDGRIWSRVKKLFGRETFRTSGGTMIATVRGTSYGHGILPGDYNRGTVLEGLVDIECIKGDNAVQLAENMKADMNCAQDIGFEPVSINDADFIDEWILFNIEEDKKLDDRFGPETYGDVLGASTKISPTITQKPGNPTYTPKPESNNYNSTGPSYTPKPDDTKAPQSQSIPTATYTPEPPRATDTPIPPPPPAIKRAFEDSDLISKLLGRLSGGTVITVEGENLSTSNSMGIDKGSFAGFHEVTDTRVTGKFSGVTCGNRTVTITTQGGSTSTGVGISSLLCLPLIGGILGGQQ